MLIKAGGKLKESDVTDEKLYWSRRQFMAGGAALALGSLLPVPSLAASPEDYPALTGYTKTKWGANEELTPFKDVTRYNNFYELGVDKGDPAENADALKVKPWSVKVEGEVGKPGEYAFEDLIKGVPLEERIYRLRCVEAWSMVIPWIGFPLSSILKKFEPSSKAKYVRMETIHAPEQLPGQRSRFSSIDWPYEEGLRIDEAMHPLTMMAVGLYGRTLPNQNGAPLRLVVPWKYGFKSIKSIVKIQFLESQPKTSWNSIAPQEYGFYANVNPKVDHPRWSQKTERRLPSGLFSVNRIDTQMFNGYGDEVGHLYAGMDLKRFY